LWVQSSSFQRRLTCLTCTPCWFSLSHTHRLGKEVSHYRQELADNEAQYQAVQADPTKDAYDAKRFGDIVEESVRMVPDAQRRQRAALEDLAAHVAQHFATTDGTSLVADEEWLPVARTILEAAAVASGETLSGDSGGVGGESTQVDDLAEGEAF
jgi:hypothetical protein